jgi:ATP-dependent protease ClpP protease subunit
LPTFRELVQEWRRGRGNRAPSGLNVAGGVATVYIYDVIGEDFWTGGGVIARDLVPEIQALQATKIMVRVNSPGGSISDAVAIRNALTEHPAEIETHIDGAAYSAASWVGMAGGEVLMHPQTSMFVHDGITFAFGNEDDLRREADFIGALSGQIAEMYAAKAGGTVDEWRAVMKAERFYTAEEAVEAGLSDRVITVAPPENALSAQEPTKRDAERALRDAGFSRDASKALVSSGWAAMTRDAGGAEESNAELVAEVLRFQRNRAAALTAGR